MPRSFIRRIAVLFILFILLAAPWSNAEPRQDRAPVRLWSQLWNRWTLLWGEIGCVIDPDGRCHGSAIPQVDIGCVIDPNGGCGR
jgi:hypothetical protein